MLAARIFPLDRQVRIILGQVDGAPGIADRVLLGVIQFRQDAIWQRSKNKLERYWSTFSVDQGADPFGSKSRVEVHIVKPFLGLWSMRLYWNPEDEAWAGMYLQLDYPRNRE